MLPYFEQPSWHFGPIAIHAFGVAVAMAVWMGQRAVDQRAARLGLSAVVLRRMGAWMLGGGLLGAHLFSVLLYFPEKLMQDPWLLLRVWEDVSSFGGMLGGLVGAVLYFRVHEPDMRLRTRLARLDAIAFVFPIALAIGRVGCALAHDHPGVVTTVPLGFSLATPAAQDYITHAYATASLPPPAVGAGLGFHDLGLYEFIFLALVLVPLFRHWDRRERRPGFFLVAFAGLYLPVRFALDLLRVTDARYVGLTPAQWVAASVLAFLPFVVVQRPAFRLALTAGVIVATACACWGGA